MSKRRGIVIGFAVAAALLTILAALFVSTLLPGVSMFVLHLFFPRHAVLEFGLQSLSDFSPRPVGTPEGEQTFPVAVLPGGTWGFEDMLALISDKRTLPVNESLITGIFILRIEPVITQFGFDLTPQYVLAVKTNGDSAPVTLLWEGELESWVRTDEEMGLQRLSFWFLILAVLLEVVASLIAILFPEAKPTSYVTPS